MLCLFVDIARENLARYNLREIHSHGNQTLYSSIPLKSVTIQSTGLRILLILTVWKKELRICYKSQTKVPYNNIIIAKSIPRLKLVVCWKSELSSRASTLMFEYFTHTHEEETLSAWL